MTKLRTALPALLGLTAAATAQVPCPSSNLGTSLGGGDDVVFASQPIGFAFPFGGATYTDVHITTNGLVYLSNGGVPTPGGTGCCAGTTAGLVAGGPKIAPFWTDLNVIAANGASVYFGSGPASCTITWDEVIEYAAPNAVPFDIQLELSISGEIKVVYGAGLNLVTAGDALVGCSPGNNAAVPTVTDWTTPGVVGDTCFELFNNTGLTVDLGGQTLFLVPSGPNGYAYFTAPQANCAFWSSYGAGCVNAPDVSSYEFFSTAGGFDLANSAMTWLRTSSGYLAVPSSATYVAPSPTATRVAIGDDVEQTVTLSIPMPVGSASSTSQLTICSNGYVSTGTGNGTGWTPNVATFLAMPRTVWSCWHDYNQTVANSGQILFEEVGGVAYVSWDGVFDFGTTAGGSTWQFQFDLASGNVTWVWGAMSGLGNGHLVGFSEGGASADPGSMDISAALPSTYAAATFAVNALSLASADNPRLGTSPSLVTTNVPAATQFGAVILGLNLAAVDLTSIGMAGCTRHLDPLATLLWFPAGNGTAATAITVPANPVYTGVVLLGQSVAYAPGAGLTLLGAVASNGISLTLGQ